jgi:hypothetical protein
LFRKFAGKELARSKIQGRNKVEQQEKVIDQGSSALPRSHIPFSNSGTKPLEEPLLANSRNSSKSSTSPSYGGDALFRDRQPNTFVAKTSPPTKQSAFS